MPIVRAILPFKVTSSGKGPGAETEAGIEGLRGFGEHVIEKGGGALVRDQRGVAAAIEYVACRDRCADRNVKRIPQEAERPITDLDRPHERHRIEMSQKMKSADTGIDDWRARQRRADRAVDPGEPKIGRHRHLQA
jgi:hypothetical protein